MTEMALPETTPRLDITQRGELLAHVLRLPGLFALAETRLESSLFFEADEPHLRILWKVARGVAYQHGSAALTGDPAQARTLLQTEVSGYVSGHPDEMPVEYQEPLF